MYETRRLGRNTHNEAKILGKRRANAGIEVSAMKMGC